MRVVRVRRNKTDSWVFGVLNEFPELIYEGLIWRTNMEDELNYC
jgi:hypothetical protein